jgi:hypothetical protein
MSLISLLCDIPITINSILDLFKKGRVRKILFYLLVANLVLLVTSFDWRFSLLLLNGAVIAMLRREQLPLICQSCMAAQHSPLSSSMFDDSPTHATSSRAARGFPSSSTTTTTTTASSTHKNGKVAPLGSSSPQSSMMSPSALPPPAASLTLPLGRPPLPPLSTTHSAPSSSAAALSSTSAVSLRSPAPTPLRLPTVNTSSLTPVSSPAAASAPSSMLSPLSTSSSSSSIGILTSPAAVGGSAVVSSRSIPRSATPLGSSTTTSLSMKQRKIAKGGLSSSISAHSSEADSEEEEEEVQPVEVDQSATLAALTPIDPSLRISVGGTLSKVAPILDAESKSNQPNTWSILSGNSFRVRTGPNYSKLGLKAPSVGTAYETLSIDMYQCERKICNIGRFLSLPSADADDIACGIPRYFIVNAQLPAYPPNNPVWGDKKEDGPGISMVFCFVLPATARRALITGIASSTSPPPGSSTSSAPSSQSSTVLSPPPSPSSTPLSTPSSVAAASSIGRSHTPSSFDPTASIAATPTNISLASTPSGGTNSHAHSKVYGHHHAHAHGHGHNDTLGIPSSMGRHDDTKNNAPLLNKVSSVSSNSSPLTSTTTIGSNTSSGNHTNNNNGSGSVHSSPRMTASPPRDTRAMSGADVLLSPSSSTSSQPSSTTSSSSPAMTASPSPPLASTPTSSSSSSTTTTCDLNLTALTLIRRFINAEAGDDVRQRFKSICRVANMDQAEFSSAAKPLIRKYNGTPFLVRTTSSFYRGDTYFEVLLPRSCSIVVSNMVYDMVM